MLQRSGRAIGLIEPCLPSPAKAPPSGPEWLHEIKHDGFRIMALRDAAGVRLFTRGGHDFTARFPLNVAVVTALSVRSRRTTPADRSIGPRSRTRQRRQCGARPTRIGGANDGRHDADQAAFDVPLCSR
jgi:hypothetical protein